MNADSGLTMAINMKVNSIINEIQLSNLNFVVNMTPFAAYITLKKSVQTDKDGSYLSPSPPVMCLFDQARSEKIITENENANLKSTIKTLEKKIEELELKNLEINSDLIRVKDDLATSERACTLLEKKITKAHNEKDILDNQLSELQKIHANDVCDLNLQIKTLNKLLKAREKDVHNLNVKVTNTQDTNKNLKYELSKFKASTHKLENEVKKLEKKVCKLKSPADCSLAKQTVASQTINTTDFHYHAQYHLPSSFRSSKHISLSKSMPNLVDSEWGVGTTDDQMSGVEKCEICCQTFSSRKALQDHNEEFPLCCRECCVCYATSHDVYQHDVQHHFFESDHEE